MKFSKALPFLLFLFFSTTLLAQKDFTSEADAAYKGEQFYSAIDLFKKAYSTEKDREKKTEIIYRIADCYRLVLDYQQAEVWYDKAIKAQYPDPIVQFYLAEVIKLQGRYDDAIVEYNKFNALKPGDPRGIEGVKSCQVGQKWVDAPSEFEVENVKLINSKSSDFSPNYASKKYDELIFTSTREGSQGSSIDPRTGQSFSDLYVTKVDRKGKWSTPDPIAPPVNSGENEGG